MSKYAWLPALLLGCTLGAAVGFILLGDSPTRCAQTTVPLTVPDNPDLGYLPAETEFRLGRIGDNHELWVPVKLPPGAKLAQCGPRSPRLSAFELGKWTR